MKSPLLSTNRPLYVNLPPRQCKHAPSSRYCTYQGDLLVRLKNSLSLVVLGDDGEVTDYQDQLKQMLQDLATEKEKDVEKPLPLMNQV